MDYENHAFPKRTKKKRDPEATREKSRIKALYRELQGGACSACAKAGCDVDHILSRGAGGTNDEANLWGLCRGCHTLKHSQGLTWLAQTYPAAKAALLLKGWSYDEYRKKWRPK